MKDKIKYLLLIIIPLFAGYIIYIFLRGDTIISRFTENLIGIKFAHTAKSGFLLSLIKNWGCDFLWAFSFTSALLYFLRHGNRRFFTASAICIICGTVLELMQKCNILSGTFDVGDIFAEAAAAVIAAITIKGVMKNEKV